MYVHVVSIPIIICMCTAFCCVLLICVCLTACPEAQTKQTPENEDNYIHSKSNRSRTKTGTLELD